MKVKIEDIHNLLKRVKDSATNYKNLKCTSIELTIPSDENAYEYNDGSRLIHNGYIKYKSVNPENGKEYMAGDVVEQLDEDRLLKSINNAQRNTVEHEKL